MKGPFDVSHETIELCAVLEGRMHSITDGRVGTLVPGEIKIMDAGVVHSSWTEREPTEEIVIHMRSTCLPPERAGLTGVYDATAVGFERVRAAAEGPEREHAVLDVLRRALHLPCERRTLEPRIDTMIRVVGHALAERWTVDRMARVAGTTPRTLRRLTRLHLHTTPTEWLAEQRVRRAADLLETGRFTASEIAYRVGFASPSRFSETFRRRRGMPPSLWLAFRRGSTT